MSRGKGHREEKLEGRVGELKKGGQVVGRGRGAGRQH
jgi:hypothetical protein